MWLKMYIRLHVKCPIFSLDFNDPEFSPELFHGDGRTDTTKLIVFAILGTRLKTVEETWLGISRHRWEGLKNTSCEDVSTLKVGQHRHQEKILTKKETRLGISKQKENFTTNQVISELCRKAVNKLKGSRYGVQTLGWTVRGSNSGRSNRFLSSPTRPHRLCGPSSLLVTFLKPTDFVHQQV